MDLANITDQKIIKLIEMHAPKKETAIRITDIPNYKTEKSGETYKKLKPFEYDKLTVALKDLPFLGPY